MSALTDIILAQVKESAGSKLDNNILGGLSDSILGSVKQSAQSASGIEQLTSLFTGKTSAAESPVTALAGKLFQSGVAKKLNLDSKTSNLATSLLPTIIGALVNNKNGLDITSILGAFAGGNTASKKSNNKSDLLGTAVGLLGKFLKK